MCVCLRVVSVVNSSTFTSVLFRSDAVIVCNVDSVVFVSLVAAARLAFGTSASHFQDSRPCVEVHRAR